MFTAIVDEIYDLFVSMWVELFFVACFAVGFAFVSIGKVKQSKAKPKGVKIFSKVHAQATSNNAAKIVSAWREVQAQLLTPCDTLRVVTQAYLDSEPSSLVDEIVKHLSQHSSDVSVPKAVVAALEVVARAGNERLMESLFQACVGRLQITATVQMQEIMLGGYATTANTTKVANLVAQLRKASQKVTVRGYALMIKGYLKNEMLDTALAQVQEMRSQGLNVPSFAIPEFFRVARLYNRSAEIFDIVISAEVSLTGATITAVLEDCLKSQDLPLAKMLEEFAQTTNVQLNFTAYEALLKLHASAGDHHAIELFEVVQQRFAHISEGLYVGLLARCAEPKFLRFAEQIVSALRSRGQMTLLVYGAIMKVYSHCHMYSKACDLYEQIKADGLEPDSMMYGCLMKISAECGRTDLTRELSSKVPQKKAHQFMSLIRAAGQDKDVDKAFAVLEQFKELVGLDTAICNAVIDVCASVGEMDRAHRLLADMEKTNLADMISYNTLLKGYCMLGDSKKAHDVLFYMEKAGQQPNDVSYNCLINMAASAGDFQAAWKSIESMERKGVRIDHYTVSTLLKALKRTSYGKDAIRKVLDLLDRHRIDVCCEEVLLNTALEACLKHGENQRLQTLLESVKVNCGRQLAPHTYGSLIKAAGALKDVRRCRELWKEMTELRRIDPTDVALGCMLDALVCNGEVLESVTLLRKWQERMPINAVVYSTLIKGFNNIGDSKGAIDMWNELRTQSVPLNTAVYNAIIDVYARLGSTQETTALVKEMQADGLKPDHITKSILAKGFCVSGELDKAIEVLHNIPGGEGSNNTIMYNTILDGCVRHNRMDLADRLLAKVESFNVTPTSFTLGIIVKMWGRRRKISEAFAAVKTLPEKYGFKANGPVKACLFFACLRNDALDSAYEVFNDICATETRVDGKMYSALINNFAKVGQCDKAVSLVEEAYGLSAKKRGLPRGEQLDSSTLEQLMKCLARQGDLKRLGEPLLKKMVDAKLPVSHQVLALSIQARDSP
jgi:pentatricopeptide repeat protein